MGSGHEVPVGRGEAGWGGRRGGAGAGAACSQSPGAHPALQRDTLHTWPAGRGPSAALGGQYGDGPGREVPSELLSGRVIGVGVTLDAGVGLSTSPAFNLPQWNRYIPALCRVTVQASLRKAIDCIEHCSLCPLRRRRGLPHLFCRSDRSSCPPGSPSWVGHAHTRRFSLRRQPDLLCSPSLGSFAPMPLDETGLCLSFLLAGGPSISQPSPLPRPRPCSHSSAV